MRQREESQTLRERSQSIFEQSESLTREAIRSLDSAEQAYGEEFAAGSAANKEAIVKVREMAAALRSRMEKNKSAYMDTLAQATDTKELATQELLAALDSLGAPLNTSSRQVISKSSNPTWATATCNSASSRALAIQPVQSSIISLAAWGTSTSTRMSAI